MANPIKVTIDPNDLHDLSYETSIVFDASGFTLDGLLEGLCIDIDNGRVQIRWGEGFGDYFVPWRPPFAPLSFVFLDREYVFCLEGQQNLPARRVQVE